MADSTGTRSPLLKILEYIWSLFSALFDGSARSELPLVAPKGFSRTTPAPPINSESVIEKECSEKEQFLRHPSVTSKRKGRQKEETRTKRYSIFSIGSSMQYLSSFVHHPRAESITVPVVIITPSSPTRVIKPLPPPSSSSSLEVIDATVESEPFHFPQSPSISEDIGEVSLTSKKQVFVPPDIIESDMIEFDSWTISAPQDASEPSFFLPESLQKITFEPIHCASHALSAVSDMLSDIPTWNAAEALAVGIPTYFTSTPPRRRRCTGMKLGDIENNYVEAIDPLESPSHDVLYQCVDLIPYPDVFDLDMYYDTTTPLRKKLTKLYSRDCTFADVLSLQNDGSINPREKLLPDDCKEKYQIVTSSVTLISSPVADRCDFKSAPSNISQSPSTPLLLSQAQEQHQIPPPISFNPHHIVPLNDSTNLSFKTSATTSSSSSVYSIQKSQRQIHSLPASAYDQKSRSNQCPQRSLTSLDESDAGSMDALYARLREVCDSTVSTRMKEVETWEPVSF